jgi:hypothetical protein
MPKKTPMTARSPAVVSPAADKWVAAHPQQKTAAGRTKRLTIDLSEEMHTRFKALCAMHKTKMVEEINRLIAVRIGEMENGVPAN